MLSECVCESILLLLELLLAPWLASPATSSAYSFAYDADTQTLTEKERLK